MSHRSTAFYVSVALVALLVAGAAVWLLFIRGDDETTGSADDQARLLSPAGLSEAASSLDGPVYWAGRQGNTGLEFTAAADGSTYVRYLPPGTDAGDPRPGFLTVATYPVENADAALSAATGRKGAVDLGNVDGVPLVTNEDSPTSVYFSPSPKVEVEVYDPSASRAAEIARSGAVQPVP